jgi:peptidoglycan hydrolase CwlO-like protein
LRTLPAKEAAQVAGSVEKRQRTLEDKETLESIYNEGKDELYRWKRVGDVGQNALTTATKTGDDVSNAYEIAKAGGKHAPWYKQQLDLGYRQLQKGIQSIEKQIADHESWIADPQKKVKDWTVRDPRYQAGLLKKWQQDIARQKEQVEILKGVFKEKNDEQ